MGPPGTKQLYEIFSTSSRKLFQIDLSGYILESDHGSTLQSIAGEHHQGRHLICLRDFLASLETKMHSFEVGNLVKAQTRQEFEIVTSLIDSNLEVIEAHRETAQYERLSAKARPGIADRSIVIENMDRRIRSR
jgi:hypothetical protein